MIESDNTALAIKTPFDWSMAVLLGGYTAFAGIVAIIVATHPYLMN